MARTTHTGQGGRAEDPRPEGRPAVLLVEDDPDCREIISLRLKEQGFRVVEAENAGAAWELAHHEPVRAAILDYALPGIDGKTLAYLLRHEFGDKVLLLGFSAWPVRELEKGHLFDSVYAKPDVGPVLAALRRIRTRRRRARHHGRQPWDRPGTGDDRRRPPK